MIEQTCPYILPKQLLYDIQNTFRGPLYWGQRNQYQDLKTSK